MICPHNLRHNCYSIKGLLLLILFCHCNTPKTQEFVNVVQPLESEEYFNIPSLSINFSGGYELISSWKRLFYRKEGGEGDFQLSPVQFTGLHAVIFNPNDSLFYGVDSDEGCLVLFSSLADTSGVNRFRKIADITLERPHDVIYDEKTRRVYLLDAKNGNVFRFNKPGQEEKYMQLPVNGYLRSLTIVDSILFVSYSSQGAILEIVDFDRGEYLVHDSYGKLGNHQFGSWESSGLIINDIGYYNGYWYATNYFDIRYNRSAKNINQNKLISFSTWNDLEQGKWNDLSYLLSDTLIPYYLTVNHGAMYLATFPGGIQWTKGGVLRLTTKVPSK